MKINLIDERNKKIKGKSIETLFRTLSKNNYRLQHTLDRKANILISINTIVISFLISLKLIDITNNNISVFFILLFGACVLSMIFSLLSVRPFVVNIKSLGMENNNLVNIIVLNNMSINDYKVKMNGILENDNKVYDSITEDIYFIGKNIHRKHILLQFSAGFFFVGLFIASSYVLFF